ncbi:nucleotidyl transferase AbiEii/AbiGii toxin family protein [Pleomorphomonas oryzae]|uniref:nucleotidyl transferase AbiEii/AbiGii toxin family protein n=1 Tax=Pleomorphomonas oryzae TaxID=261934 RepID=UPI000421CE7C|nr:nucleotidyl transferase AbiEii/AbiGii toxin family protein [Pleomorphomonas oryzae]
MFRPRLEILPEPQQRLWPELVATPPAFTLYGGTAIALRLGHRFSVDFDFFSTAPFVPAELYDALPYLKGGILQQSAANTLTVSVDRGGPVQLSFFGRLRIGQVEAADPVEGPAFPVASLLDLSGMKVAVITQRAEVKDYLDLHALLTVARIDLPTMLAAATIIYAEGFNPLIALKAISYHDDPALTDLPTGIRKDLAKAVRAVDIHALPRLAAVRERPLP